MKSGLILITALVVINTLNTVKGLECHHYEPKPGEEDSTEIEPKTCEDSETFCVEGMAELNNGKHQIVKKCSDVCPPMTEDDLKLLLIRHCCKTDLCNDRYQKARSGNGLKCHIKEHKIAAVLEMECKATDTHCYVEEDSTADKEKGCMEQCTVSTSDPSRTCCQGNLCNRDTVPQNDPGNDPQPQPGNDPGSSSGSNSNSNSNKGLKCYNMDGIHSFGEAVCPLGYDHCYEKRGKVDNPKRDDITKGCAKKEYCSRKNDNPELFRCCQANLCNSEYGLKCYRKKSDNAKSERTTCTVQGEQTYCFQRTQTKDGKISKGCTTDADNVCNNNNLKKYNVRCCKDKDFCNDKGEDTSELSEATKAMGGVFLTFALFVAISFHHIHLPV